MKVAISGAGGFVGRHLVSMFKEMGWTVAALHTSDFRGETAGLAQKLKGADVIIHLAGASINKRWTEAYKQVLYSSRIDTTDKLVAAMENMEARPQLFVCTSAVGIYSSEGKHDEENAVYADDFLGRLVRDWEAAASKAEQLAIRTVIFRYGIILGRGGGILQEMILPFRLGLGGTIGDGSQNFSWVHIRDLMRAYLFVIEHPQMRGVYNLMTPKPATNHALTKALASVLHRPAFLSIPRFLIALRFGSEAAEALASGQYATPKRLSEAGFEFEFTALEGALNDLYG